MASETKLSKDIKLILKANASLQFDESIDKVKCSISGHEMPCQLDQIQIYLNGKKFKKSKAKQDVIYEKYKPHIVPNTKEGHKHQLFCLLTTRVVNKSVKHVERHMNGVKYKNALAEWEANKDKKPTKKTEEKTPEETCLVEEDEEEDDDDLDEEGRDDLTDLYPDMGGDDSDDDGNENDSHVEKTRPTTSKRKSNFKKEPEGQIKKQKKTRRK